MAQCTHYTPAQKTSHMMEWGIAYHEKTGGARR